MSEKKSVVLIIFGLCLFIAGGDLAFTFYNFGTGIVQMTIWSDVIFFGLISRGQR